MNDRGDTPSGREDERGKRAAFDPHSGEVTGSGSGAGGSNPGEDFDDDAAAGGGSAPGGPLPAKSEGENRPQKDRSR